MRHAGVGGTASAFELVGRHRLVRTQTAQVASKYRLGSLDLNATGCGGEHTLKSIAASYQIKAKLSANELRHTL